MKNFCKNLDLLFEAVSYWESMNNFRNERARCKRYCYGDQWGDLISVDGKWVKEESYIRSQGSEPLKNNLIRRLVKQVLGLYRSETKPCTVGCDDKRMQKGMMNMLEKVARLNCYEELNARALEEFLISGMVVQRKSYGWRNGGAGCWTVNVPLDLFFVDSHHSDCRGWDVGVIGEIHDMRFDAVCAEFAHNSEDVEALRAIYNIDSYRQRVDDVMAGWGMAWGSRDKFFFPCQPQLCRVVEVWKRERKPGYLCHDRKEGVLAWVDARDFSPHLTSDDHDVQWMMADEWHYYFLSPFGDIIDEGASPYAHGQHPFVFKAYPMVDGEMHSFVADVIDQQRYTNRLITLYDWVMRSSAKGVLLVPEECIPDGYTIEDMADEWARFNGVIPVKSRDGMVMPQQVAANAVNIGINELLQTQLNFMEDISGVTGALQGKTTATGVSGKLYEQQTRNATLAQLDLLDTFHNFIRDGLAKDISNIQQFYESDKLDGIPAEQIPLFRRMEFRLE